MPAEVSNTDYKAPHIARYFSWCAGCEGRTHLRLNVEEPTCDRCGTPFERPEIGPDTSHLPTSPFEYSQFPTRAK